MSEVVSVKDVSKTYRLGTQTVTALADVCLTVHGGEFMAVAGPSGSGKTTLLNLIGCLDTPTSGEIAIDGEAITRLTAGRRADLRARKLGFIFQTFNLIPVLTAWENVEYPLLIHRRGGDVAGRVRAALAQVGLGERTRHRPSELSGGQQQRVAIARALVGEPSLVLADEPTANLDSATGREIVDLMRRLNRERGTTFVFSTHDPRIMSAADRVVEISDGRLR
ncbi:MAG: lipoprotein-releasing system ATP-binding protein LolD [Candidatus Rokuibacteriota bacterium]|nr:MAG: lipoprotein-releasing system ATP-binding protein LolD [Candidatus Rokubacteria bacterium]